MSSNPLVGPYRTADERWLLLNMLDDTRHFAPTCRALGLTDLLDDGRFADTAGRAEHRVVLHDRLVEAIASRTLADLRERLDAEDTIVSALASPVEVVEDPQVLANGYFAAHPTRPSVRLATAPMQFDDEQTVIRRPAPDTGEHTDEVLAELGYAVAEITALRRLGAVVRGPDRAARPGPLVRAPRGRRNVTGWRTASPGSNRRRRCAGRCSSPGSRAGTTPPTRRRPPRGG